MKQPSYANIVCHCMESGNRAAVLNEIHRLPEEYIYDIIRTLQFTPIQALAFMWALTKSSLRNVALQALDMLRKKLPEIENAADVPEELLQQILLTVVLTPVSVYVAILFMVVIFIIS